MAMANTGKCPSCEKIIQKVKVEEIDISDGLQNEWKCFSYQCPGCSAVLGVQINPVALNEDLKENIRSEFQRTPPMVG
jgi:hypothetical protein